MSSRGPVWLERQEQDEAFQKARMIRRLKSAKAKERDMTDTQGEAMATLRKAYDSACEDLRLRHETITGLRAALATLRLAHADLYTEWNKLAADNDALRAALEKIADEQKIYRGHGDYDIIPALTAEAAQDVARAALNRGKEQS